MMRKVSRLVGAGVGLVFSAFVGTGLTAPSAQALNIDLGFVMDKSNSILDSDFNNAMHALATALQTALAPTIGTTNTYTVSVVTFNDAAANVVTRTTVNSVSALNSVVSAVNAAATGSTGNTNYQAAFQQLGANFASGLGDYSIINMMTDGDPNRPSGVNPFTAALTSRDALFNAGWDSLSFEAVGNGITDPNFLRQLAFDTADTAATLNNLQPLLNNPALISDPLNNAFVLQVANFGTAYTDAVNAKLQAIVNPVPIPGALPLLASALGLLGWFRVRGRRTAAIAAA